MNAIEAINEPPSSTTPIWDFANYYAVSDAGTGSSGTGRHAEYLQKTANL